MKCLILAAGYATRLYPLCENFPKPLLSVGGRAILDWLIDDLWATGKIDEFIIISNAKFINHFKEYAKARGERVLVLCDGTYTSDTRLGAVNDIKFAKDTLGINEDILVIGGDNLLDFSLSEFVDYALVRKRSCVLSYFEEDTEKLRKMGTASVGEDGKILSMSEKSPNPKSHWCIPPFYFITGDDLSLIDSAIADGCETDAPGSFIAWLSENSSVYAMKMKGKRYDIGSLQSYGRVAREYRGITVK